MASHRRAQQRDLERWLRTHHQIITTAEAARIGMSQAVTARLVRDGRLERRMRAVCADAGARVTPEMEIELAVRAAGPGAVASHGSAGWLWGLIDDAPDPPHVTVPRARRPRTPGATVHQTRDLGEQVTHRGMRLTSATRTLIEMAADLPQPLLCDALQRGLDARLTAVPKLVDLARRYRRAHRSGASQVLAALEVRGYLLAPEQSALEARMAELFDDLHRTCGVPRPEREHRVEGGRYRLDFAWPALRLAVEVDGYAWHSSPEQMAADLARRNELVAHGWTVLVFTWRQLEQDPAGVAEAIRAAYRRAA